MVDGGEFLLRGYTMHYTAKRKSHRYEGGGSQDPCCNDEIQNALAGLGALDSLQLHIELVLVNKSQWVSDAPMPRSVNLTCLLFGLGTATVLCQNSPLLCHRRW